MNSNSRVFTKYQQVQFVLYTGADSINLILGSSTNVYVLWLMMTGERGTIVSNFIALNLTISEILTCLSSLMFILHDNIYGPYPKKSMLWNIAIFFKGFTLAGRPLFQCCICLERYLAVVHPIIFLKYKPLRYKIGCCAVIWLLVLGCCIAYIIPKDHYALNDFTLCLILVTFSGMLFCCLALLRVLKHPSPGDVEGVGTNNMKMKLRAFRIILFIMVSMIFMYLPLTILLIMYHLIEIVNFHFGMSICFSITIVTGFVQPLLYLQRSGKLACFSLPEEPSSSH